jgi:branched-chain amino acid transport system substrate-binding protein
MTDRKAPRLLVPTLLCAVLALVSSACGSAVSRSEMRAANGALQTRADISSTGSAATTGSNDGAVTEANGTAASTSAGQAPDAASQASGATGASGGSGAAQSSRGTTASAGPSIGIGTSGKKSEILFGTFGVEAGVLGAVTGPAPPAIRAWTSYINAKGGLNGHPVRVIFGDDGGDPGRAQAIVRQMVEQDHVIAFFYDYSISTLPAVKEYLEKRQIPIIGTIGGDTTSDHSPMMFNPLLGPDTGQAWSYINNVATNTDKKNLGVIYCREATTCSAQVASFKKFLPYKGEHIVYQAQSSLAQPDYTAEMLGARNAGADVILALMDSASVIRMAQSAHRQNYRPVFVGTYNLYQDLIIAGGKELAGLSLNSRSVPWDTSPLQKDYRDAIARYQPGAHVGDVGAAVFIVGKLLAEKIAPFLGEPATTAQLIQGLYSLHNEKLGGLLPGITFNKGEHINVNQCMVPILFDGAKFHAHDAAESFVCAPGWKPGT